MLRGRAKRNDDDNIDNLRSNQYPSSAQGKCEMLKGGIGVIG